MQTSHAASASRRDACCTTAPAGRRGRSRGELPAEWSAPGIISVADPADLRKSRPKYPGNSADRRLTVRYRRLSISAAARELDLSADPSAVQAVQLTIDALDKPAVMSFWRAALGYEPMGGREKIWMARQEASSQPRGDRSE